MYIFNADLDNTLIFSYKHNIGIEKLNVELYQGREISFMTELSFKLLKEVNKKAVFVPTTTRTAEQYKRIDFGMGPLKYALVCNGGILLKDGIEDEDWYQKSLELAGPASAELDKAAGFLEKDLRRSFEVRFINRLFVFTKCRESLQVVKTLRSLLNTLLVEVFNNGEKIYVLPKKLNKGKAILRFREKLSSEFNLEAPKILAAGDSEFDTAMSRTADVFIAPYNSQAVFGQSKNLIFMSGKQVFSDEMLQYILNYIYNT